MDVKWRARICGRLGWVKVVNEKWDGRTGRDNALSFGVGTRRRE